MTPMQTLEKRPVTATTESAPILPGLDTLGYGYNVQGNYADPRSCTLPLFDFGDCNNTIEVEQKTYRIPSSVEIDVHELNTFNYQNVTGTTITDYLSSLNTVTKISGNYGFFQGSLETSFSETQINNNQNDFATIRYVVNLWSLQLPDLSVLKPLLRSSVKNDLATMAANDLFDKYGTHFVWQSIVGGRGDYNATISRSYFSDESQLDIAAQMSYETLTGSISAENKTKYQQQIQTFLSNASYQTQTIGGNPAYGNNAIIGGPEAFQKWVDSVNDQPRMVDFNNQSLHPIWDLCETDARRQELLTAYDKYMSFKLSIKYTKSLITCGSDAGSGAHMDVQMFKPTGIPNGYYWLGQLAQGNYGPIDPNAQMLLVKPSHPDAVAAPVDFVQVWNDHGSGKSLDYSVWRPVPPTDYVAMGDIARLGKDNYDKPSGDEISGLVCIHKSLVSQATVASDNVWNDHGTHAHEDVSLWPILPADDNSIVAGTYYANNSYDRPNTNNPICSCIQKSKTVLV